MLEHASAFSTFPDDGVHIAPRMATRVSNYDGRVIDDFEPQQRVFQILCANLALNDIRNAIGVLSRATPYIAYCPHGRLTAAAGFIPAPAAGRSTASSRRRSPVRAASIACQPNSIWLR